jgi:hypothetical protein
VIHCDPFVGSGHVDNFWVKKGVVFKY